MVFTAFAFCINAIAASFCLTVGIRKKNVLCISLGGINAALAVVNLIRIIAMVGSNIG